MRGAVMSCDFTIYDMIARCAALYPEKDIMVYEGNRSTFKTYKKRCDQYAAGLMRDKMLLAKGKITKEMIAMLSTWRHSGFHVFCGNRISPDEETAMENLARYIIYPEGHTRASFSYPEGHKQERMQYLDQEGKVVYTSKDKKTSKVFPAWSGWPTCAPTSPTGANRWCVTTDTIATSHRVNGRWKETMTPFPPSSSRRGMKRHSGETGPG
jgi:hypothetical protein